MKKIFKKSHFWKNNRTFIEVDANEPVKNRGFAEEGNLLLKIGESSQIKSAFKLSVDEARSLRDALDMFLRFHDMKLSEYMTEQREQFEKMPDYYEKNHEPVKDYNSYNELVSKPEESKTVNHVDNESPSPMFIFDTPEPKKETEEEKPKKFNSEFYF